MKPKLIQKEFDITETVYRNDYANIVLKLKRKKCELKQCYGLTV